MGEHEQWFHEAATAALRGLCLRAKCGAVIVSDGEVIGRGYNAPPKDDVSVRQCHVENYDRSKKPKYDLTCCVHAEWRAIMDALRNHANQIQGSTLYYARLDDAGKFRPSGKPFCTVCSRLACDCGIAFFALWHESGIVRYNTKDYNARSYSYHATES
jgi:hypothetical protein